MAWTAKRDVEWLKKEPTIQTLRKLLIDCAGFWEKRKPEELGKLRYELAMLDQSLDPAVRAYALAYRDMLSVFENELRHRALLGVCIVCLREAEITDACPEHYMSKLCYYCAGEHYRHMHKKESNMGA